MLYRFYNIVVISFLLLLMCAFLFMNILAYHRLWTRDLARSFVCWKYELNLEMLLKSKTLCLIHKIFF